MSDNNKKPVVKGELLSYGFAPYQDNPTQRQSYFVEIKHDNGIAKKEWGVDLERALNESNVQIGETVILNNLGRQPVNIPDPQDETKTKTVTKNLWEVEKYEPVLDLPNVIEHDTEREQAKAGVLDKTKENEQGDPSMPNQAKKVPDLSEFDFELPDNIKNNYFGIVKNRYLLDQKTNYYDKDDKNQVNIAFEDRNKSLHTSRQDEKTIYAMLDMAQAKNWTAIKLKGTEEFKQKAWLEASLRGIGVKGYEPNEKDLAELQAKQAERTTNQVEMTTQKAPEPTQQAETVGTQIQEQKPVVLDILAYHTFDSQKQDKAYLERVGADFTGVVMERTASNFNEVKENAKNFTGRELTNFHSGITAVVSRNALDKMLSDKAYIKSANVNIHRIAVSNADKLFENAVFGWQSDDKNQDRNTNAVHRAIAPLKIDDAIYIAKLTIKEFANEADGNRFYSIEAVELEDGKSPIPEMVADDIKYNARTDRLNGALIDIIVQKAQEYNRQNQKNIDDLQNYNKDQLQDEPQQTPPTQAEPLDIGVQTQEQSHVQNDRFTFEVMTAEDVGIGESEYLRQATHITDRETGEHYIIGNYDFEHDGNVHNGVIAEYYTDEQALAERDDNALIGGERIFSKLGIHDKGLVNHIEGDSRLTAEQLDKAVSLETLKNTVSNQPIMPNKEFELVSESAKQAEFDSRELALAQTAMLRNYDVSWDRLDQHEKYERLASSVGEYKIDEQKYNQFIDNLQRNINQDLSYLKYETKEINQEPTPQKSAEDIKKDIRQIFQTGYKDGSIKSRDELVEVLKERGFEVKENDKSIRVSLPNSDQAVNLKGEVFTKGYDAIKSLKERLEPETLKQTYPTLTDSDIVHVTAYKNKLFDSNRDMQTPKALQASLVRLEDSVKDMAKGKDVNLPDLPVNEIKPDIEVRTTDNHDKSRQV